MSFPGGQAFDVCNTNDKIKELILKVSPYNQDTCEVTNQFLVSNDNQGFLQPGMVPISNALSNSRSYSKSRAKSNSNSNSIVNSISFNPGSQEL
jgi:hypothetical protein